MWLSVIIPIYNPPQEIFLKNIRELVNNLHDDIEILLIDDGSDLWVKDIVKDVVRENQNIKYYRKENGGVSSARNYGLGLANGEYVTFADADDELYLDRIFARRYEIPSQMTLVIFDFIREQIDNGEQIRFSLFDDNKIIKILDGEKEYSCFSKLRESVAKLYSRNFLLKNKIQFDADMVQAEDLVFLFEVINHCKEFYYCHEVVYRYLWNMETTNKRIVNKPIKRLEDAKKAYLVQCDFFKDDKQAIDLCTDSFLNTLGSRTLLLIYYDAFTHDVKEKIKELFIVSRQMSNTITNKRAKVYHFLFRNNLWTIFKLLAEYRYRGKKRCIDE